jgi:hypothetical protein
MPTASSELNAALYNVTQAIEDRLGDLTWAGFQVGDEVQQGFLNFFFDVATLQAFRPQYINRLGSNIAERTTDALRVLVPGEPQRLAIQEFQNNYEVYNLVKHVHDTLQEPQGKFELAPLLTRAYALGQYPDLWAVEGLGHDYAAAFGGPQQPTGMLLEANTGEIPVKALTMLHAGIGLAFAEQLMKTITPYSTPGEIRRTLEKFVALCVDNSRPGYTGAAWESLGLVTRTWHSQMVPIVDRQLRRINEGARLYFWHGAGRALYFLPIHFVPGVYSPWLSVETDAPDELARRNAIAGLAWANTIVNIRQPAILADLLRRRGSHLVRDDAFIDGVLSVLLMAGDITPGDLYIAEFCRYQPPHSVEDLWQRTAGLACKYVNCCYNGNLEEIFRYQPFEELSAKLC